MGLALNLDWDRDKALVMAVVVVLALPGVGVEARVFPAAAAVVSVLVVAVGRDLESLKANQKEIHAYLHQEILRAMGRALQAQTSIRKDRD